MPPTLDHEALLATVAARLSRTGHPGAAVALAHTEVAGIKWYNDGGHADIHLLVEVDHYDALMEPDLVQHPTAYNDWNREYDLPSELDLTFVSALPPGTKTATVEVRLLNVPVSPSWRRDVVASHGRQLAAMLDSRNLPGDSDIRLHLARLQRLDQEPEELIGAAKDLVEAAAKHVVAALGEEADDDDITSASKAALTLLKLHPATVAPTAKGAETIRHVLGSLQQIAAGVAELRNMGYGTGHGRERRVAGLQLRHAELAARAAIAYAAFLLDTLAQEDAPWKQSS